MPNDKIRPPTTAEWVNHWIDLNIPPDPTDIVAWRYAVGCTTTLSISRLTTVLELISTAVSTHRLTPLDMLLLGNMLTAASQHQWNQNIAPAKRKYLSQIFSASADVAEDYVEGFRENGLPTTPPD